MNLLFLLDAGLLFTLVPDGWLEISKRKVLRPVISVLNRTKVAKGMGRVYKGRNNKRILSKGARQAKLKINITPILTAMVTGHGKNQGLPPPLQSSGTCKLPMWQRRSNHRTFTQPVFDTTYTKRNI
jgi:hypothetical protein